MASKTRVTELQIGDVIDFDVHTGNHAHYNDTLNAPDGSHLPYDGWEKVTGRQKVAKIERVMAPVTSGMRKRYATAIRITFDDGRSIDRIGTSKLPVVS
jgi:hypothetical protein